MLDLVTALSFCLFIYGAILLLDLAAIKERIEEIGDSLLPEDRFHRPNRLKERSYITGIGGKINRYLQSIRSLVLSYILSDQNSIRLGVDKQLNIKDLDQLLSYYMTALQGAGLPIQASCILNSESILKAYPAEYLPSLSAWHEQYASEVEYFLSNGRNSFVVQNTLSFAPLLHLGFKSGIYELNKSTTLILFFREEASEVQAAAARKIISNFVEEYNRVVDYKNVSDEAISATQKYKSRDDWLSQVSHDVKTPLHNLFSLISLLDLESDNYNGKNKAEFLRLLEHARSNCISVRELVESLLDVTSIELGRTKVYKESLPATAFVREVVSGFLPASRLKGLSLEFSSEIPLESEDSYFIVADRQHLRRSLSNLISNAIKYTHVGGVSVEVIANHDSISINISDTGIGINPEHVKKLTVGELSPGERFAHEGIEGLGVGIYVTRLLVEQNNGMFQGDSNLGKGTKFTITLPAEILAAESLKVEVEQDLNTKQILIIDDDWDYLHSLSRHLAKEGFSPLGADSITDALYAIEKNDNFYAIICDDVMPDGGVQTLLYKCKDMKLPPIIVSTGRSETEHKNRLVGLGAYCVLQKPYLIEDLKEILNNFNSPEAQAAA